MNSSPVTVEMIIRHLKEGGVISAFQRIKHYIFGGAKLRQQSGEWLQEHGINCRNIYCCTEISSAMLSNMDPNCKNWYSLQCPWNSFEITRPYIFENVEDEQKHLYAKTGCLDMGSIKGNRECGGYDASDIFVEEPGIPGNYDYVRRRDDTIILENGEKINLISLENTICQSPMVKQVGVFGNNRVCTSALIEIDLDYAINFSPDEIILAVHEAVENANKECSGYSTILLQMVKILPFN